MGFHAWLGSQRHLSRCKLRDAVG